MKTPTFLLLVLSVLLVGTQPALAGEPPPRKKIVLLAGKKSHGPIGNGIHDYGWSARLLQVMLTHSSIKDLVTVECHLEGWPKDPKTLEDAATILVISDGRDGDRFEEAPFLASPERVRFLEGLMKKGCGLMTFHFSTFAPQAYADQVLDWTGGYFQWETDGKRQWYSAITTTTAEVQVGTPDHPIARGLKPFTLHEEFYYNLRFRPKDEPITPIWVVPALKGREPDGNVVAWAHERSGGGRGFGTTCGHFYDNWKEENFRKLILNALAWTAHLEVPQDGVEGRFYTHEEINKILGDYPPEDKPESKEKPEALAPGRFGKALDAGVGVAVVLGREEYRRPPLTVECWARLLSRENYNILVASDTKASADHWELFTMPGTGHLTAYLPGRTPDHVRSDANVADGRWHYLALVDELDRARLYVDGRQVAEQTLRSKGEAGRPGDLAIGTLVEGGLGCRGLIDEVRLSRGVRTIDGIPDGPFVGDERSLGLWHFDSTTPAVEGKTGATSDDASTTRNPARLVSAVGPPPPAAPPEGPNYQPADARLKAVLLDRQPSDAYLGIKVDTQGQVFVGGREAVFVFEPNDHGGYQRRTLLSMPPDSNVIGLELRGNDLYVLTNSALYLVREGRTRRTDLKAERLLWGLPLDLHVSFHCMAWGPEGDLYLDHGDPLLNFGDWSRPDHWGHWTLHPQPEGTQVPYTGVGAVLRLRPDGSHLRVVSTGYRGPVGLAFDRDWNLFSNDNDHESLAHLYAPARLLHVTPHSDFAWPRGWMASKSPDRADLLEPMTAGLGRGVPCGLAYYDEPFLPDDYRHNLLMGRWDSLMVTRYPLQPRGASFQTEEQPFLVGRNLARPVGVAVGRGGRVFATVLYLPGNVGAPHCYSDLLMVTRADDPTAAPFDAYDVTTLAAEQLWAELSSPSWERRHVAHTELLRRGGDLLTEAVRRLATVQDEDPALLHLPWLAAASGSPEAGERLSVLARQARPEVRLQAVRALIEFPQLKVSPALMNAALADPSLAVRLAALDYFFEPGQELPLAAVVKLAESEDSYLRQTATRLLAQRASVAEIRTLTRSANTATRLAGVLAAGVRLTVPPWNSTPPEAVTLSYTSGNAFFALRYADAPEPINLRALGRTGSYTTAQWWAALTPTPEQNELFELLLRTLDDSEPSVRLQSAYWLSLLHDRRCEDRIAAVRQQVQVARLARGKLRDVERVWLVGPFADEGQGLQRSHPPEEGVIDLTSLYPTPEGKRAWQELAGKEGRFAWDSALGTPKDSSVYLSFRLESLTAQPALLLVGSEATARIWVNGRPVQGEAASLPVELQPGSNDVLVRLHHGDGLSPVELRYRALGEVVATLPEKLDSTLLSQRLREAGTGAEKVPAEFLQVDWTREVEKGDAGRGRQLFGKLGCVKCHAIAAGQQGGGAPSLTDARRRFTVAHLVESVLLPSKQVAEPFRSTVLALKSGQVVTGLVVGETGDSLEVLLPDTAHRTIRKQDVEERTVSPVSPMPPGLVKTPEELRDLLAYLLSANPLPP